MQGGFTELHDLGEVAGVPVSVWVSTFRLTHRTSKGDVAFESWPDGEPLNEQEQVMVNGFEMMRDETLAYLGEQARQ